MDTVYQQLLPADEISRYTVTVVGITAGIVHGYREMLLVIKVLSSHKVTDHSWN